MREMEVTGLMVADALDDTPDLSSQLLHLRRTRMPTGYCTQSNRDSS